jgi:cytochrome b561
MSSHDPSGAARYPIATRVIHWATALAVLGLVPVGIVMASRGAANIWDGLTNTLYAWHKLIGFTVLLFTLLRIAVKLRRGAPAYPPSLPRWQAAAAHGLHGLLYVLLVVVPLLGWAGITAYPALMTVGGYDMPRMPFVPQNQELAASIFRLHAIAAITLVALLVGHVGAALMHLVVKKDGIFQRMWFGR